MYQALQVRYLPGQNQEGRNTQSGHISRWMRMLTAAVAKQLSGTLHLPNQQHPTALPANTHTGRRRVGAWQSRVGDCETCSLGIRFHTLAAAATRCDMSESSKKKVGGLAASGAC